jgi:hypothetical protein
MEAAMNATTTIAAPAVPSPPSVVDAVLTVRGIEKAYRRAVWPARRTQRVLRGVELALYPGEWSVWSARTAPASRP